jgi:hypothetical protein
MNHNSNGMYNVLNIFKKLEPTTQEQTKAEAKAIYESVEAQGSIIAGVSDVEKRLSEAYAATKEGKYGDDGIDYSGKFGDRKAEKPPVDTKFDTRGIASMMGKKPAKPFGKVSASNKLALPGEDDDLSESESGERPYVCVHAKKGKCEVNAKSSYEAAKKAAEKWKLKNTSGIDSYLADVKHTAVDESEEQLDEYFNFDTKSSKDKGRGDELARRAKLGKNPLAKGSPTASEYKQKGKFGDMYDIAGPKGALPESEMEEGKPRNKYAIGMAAAKKAAGFGKKPAHDLPKSVITKGHKIAKSIDEAEPTMPSKKPEQAKKKPVSPFGKQKVSEGVNFTEMMKKQHATLEEMLKTLSDDIAEFKRSGHVSEPLRDCMGVYEYGKTQLSDAVEPEQVPAFMRKSTEPGRIAAQRSNDMRNANAGADVWSSPRPAPMGEPDEELNELARLAGLSLEETVDKKAFAALAEPKDKITYADKIAGATKKNEDLDESCDTIQLGDMASEMEQHQGKINVTTNASSDGNKSVSINADGAAAEQLMAMLKMAGLGGGDAHARLATMEPESGEGEVEVEMDEAVGEEDQYANTPEECYQGQDVIAHQGADMNREKKQFADKPKAGDNPMATPESVDPVAAFGRDLMAEYQSLKLKK